MNKTAIDIVLEGVSNGSITQEDAKILLDAFNQKPGVTYIPTTYPSNPYWTSNPDWTYDPNRPGQPWYTTTGTDSTTYDTTNKTTTTSENLEKTKTEE